MTRNEQEYYRNIERIAVALEKMVAHNKDQVLDQFKRATNGVYGNEPTTHSEDKLKAEGRSMDNYQYPLTGKSDTEPFIETTYETEKTSLSGFKPIINSDTDQRIYDQSQTVTGGMFDAWYQQLTSEEKDSWKRVYSNSPDNSTLHR